MIGMPSDAKSICRTVVRKLDNVRSAGRRSHNYAAAQVTTSVISSALNSSS